MDFFDNVVNKSNALIKERLNNPFGSKQAPTSTTKNAGDQPETSPPTENVVGSSTSQQPASASSGQQQQQQTNSPTHANISSSSIDHQTGDDSNKNEDKNSQFAAIAADAEAVAQKAAKGAKNFGTFLFSMANKAGQHVTQTAKQVKQAVESTSILTDFTREQQEFIKEHGGSLQAGELPWENCQNEAKSADMREQILLLSQDKRNFVKGPPNDANFEFDAQKCYPVALSLLKEDPNLSKMRYDLVPKLVNEDTFWRNYFYRVSLLKQMSEKGEYVKKGWSSSRSSSGEGPDEDAAGNDDTIQNDEPPTPSYSTPGTNASELRQLSLAQQQQISNSDTSTIQTTTITEDATTTNYQTQDLESSESRKLVAEADDLKSKLKELNIGSLDDHDG